MNVYVLLRDEGRRPVIVKTRDNCTAKCRTRRGYRSPRPVAWPERSSFARRNISFRLICVGNIIFTKRRLNTYHLRNEMSENRLDVSTLVNIRREVGIFVEKVTENMFFKGRRVRLI